MITIDYSGKNVLVVGGTSLTSDQVSTVPLDSVLASAEIYDPTTGFWTPTGSMGQARQKHTATLLANGKVLVAGGDNYFGGVLPTTAEVYDPDTGEWSPTLPLISARREHIATLLPNGKVLVAGGYGTTGSLADAEVYDPATGTFSMTSAMVDARYGSTATLLRDGSVLAIGGKGPMSPSCVAGPLSSAELFR